MLVPLAVAVSFSSTIPADKMLLPGAKTSAQGPCPLKEDMASELVVDPTVIAFGSLAGDFVQALPP